MDVLICAAGSGSRLANYTHDLIPKFLINLDTHTGLYYIIKYWNKYANNIYLVINSCYNIITKSYIDNNLKDLSDKITLLNYDSCDGTAFTISHILNNELKNKTIKNLLLTWCDIYPDEEIDFNKLSVSNKIKNESIIHIFTNGNKCRYTYNTINNTIDFSPESDGNIIGIYYFKNYVPFVLGNESKNRDIIDFLNLLGEIKNYELKKIIDYGDEEKFLNIINKKSEKIDLHCRSFNKIEIINKDKILKKGIDDLGRKLIINEKNWYKYILNKNIDQKEDENVINNISIPKVFSFYDFGYLMEYKYNHIPLFIFLKNYEKKKEISNNKTIKTFVKNIINNSIYNILKRDIFKNIIGKLSILHNYETKNVEKLVFFKNLKIEIFDKVFERKKIIQNVLDYFGPIKYVNGVEIKTFENIIDNCKNIITQYYKTLNKYEYVIIHGDCNFSNILINPGNINDIYFIDPRGYFGESTIFGPKEYDYAKLLYAISGYDRFNKNNFNLIELNKDKKSIIFEIDPFIFDKKILSKYFNKVHKAFLVIIWLSLAEYNKNNIWKCMASFYYGLYLGTSLL